VAARGVRRHRVPVWLGHGASGGPETMSVYLEPLRELGIEASPLRLPKGRAERAVPALRAQVGPGLCDAVIGGHSFGGRVASLVAAETAPLGLVLLSYPLHRPGHPEELRTEHWPRIACPVLVLSGDRDPFARVDLLRRSVAMLRNAQVHVYPGLGHGLRSCAADVAERIARFVGALEGRRAPSSRTRQMARPRSAQ
jgi:predicted alpha/beta-hydrolase family hydrolase